MRPPHPLLSLPLVLLLACPGGDKASDTGGSIDRDADGFTVADGDCDDGAPTIFPGAPESCNGVDDDCDSIVDEDAVDGDTWWSDVDGDGFGDPEAPQTGCTQPGGTVDNADDCDDSSELIAPGAEEHCDGVDEDCDDSVDEDAVDAVTWYADNDGDGFGVEGDVTAACEQPKGYAGVAGDCDDIDGDAWPGAPETCSGTDSDCNGRIDDAGCPVDLDAAWVWTASTVGGLQVRDLAVGDIDGDGHADLVLGQPEQLDGQGVVRFARGPLDDRGLPPLTTIEAGDSGDQGGHVVSVGDVDGDGHADLLAGTPFADSGAGGAWLFAGPIEGAPMDYDGRIGGADSLDFLGQWLLQPGGDLDDDGTPDVVIGAPGSGSGGAVYVVADPLETSTSVDFAAATITAATSTAGLGYAAATPGDIDGDGVDDLLTGTMGEGELQLFLGPLSSSQTTADADWRVHGDAGDGVGSRVAVADVDGDGADDILAGSRQADDEAGAVLVFSVDLSRDLGADDAWLVIGGPASGAWLGGPDAGLATFDVDGDGADDLLLGSPGTGADGTAWLLFGGPERTGSGAVDVLADRIVEGPDAGAGHGATVAMGALDGTGLGSLVVAGTDADSLLIVPPSALLTSR